MLKVFVDLKSLVSINLYNPVLHNTAGCVPHTYISRARIKFYMEGKYRFLLKNQHQTHCKNVSVLTRWDKLPAGKQVLPIIQSFCATTLWARFDCFRIAQPLGQK